MIQNLKIGTLIKLKYQNILVKIWHRLSDVHFVVSFIQVIGIYVIPFGKRDTHLKKCGGMKQVLPQESAAAAAVSTAHRPLSAGLACTDLAAALLASLCPSL